jgi:hypothetical protein
MKSKFFPSDICFPGGPLHAASIASRVRRGPIKRFGYSTRTQKRRRELAARMKSRTAVTASIKINMVVSLSVGSPSSPTERLKIAVFPGKRHQTRHLDFEFFGC